MIPLITQRKPIHFPAESYNIWLKKFYYWFY